MGLKKGQCNNRKGRPKGTPNRVTTETKVWIKDLIDSNRTTFENDLKNVKPEARLAILEKLMSYAVPKMQSVEAKLDIENLSETQIDEIVKQIKESL